MPLQYILLLGNHRIGHGVRSKVLLKSHRPISRAQGNKTFRKELILQVQGTRGRKTPIMKTYTFPMEITKQKAQSLRMKMRNAELYLKEATVIYGLQQDYPN